VKEIARFSSDDIKLWREKGDELKVLQDKWREIGQVPFKMMNDMNKEFREAVNIFFDKRSEVFGELDKERDGVLKKKEELVNKALELKDSEDWQPTANALKALQREWGTTGPDVFRDAVKLRKKFRKACDHFFDRYKAHMDASKSEEDDNLKKKRTLNDEIGKLLSDAKDNFEAIREEVETRIDAWMEVGLVPIKARDKVETDFERLVEKFYRTLIPNATERRLIIDELRFRKLKHRPNGDRRMDQEDNRLKRRQQGLEEQIAQFENNISFIAPGKKGDELRKQIQDKINIAREELKLVKAEVKRLREIQKAEKQAKQEAEPQAAAGEVAQPTANEAVVETHTETGDAE
jgi:hypothetical protein